LIKDGKFSLILVCHEILNKTIHFEEINFRIEFKFIHLFNAGKV